MPHARQTNDFASEKPPVNTEVEPLAEVYVGPIKGQRNLNPSVPVVSTVSMPLTRLFRLGGHSEEERDLGQPDITTIARPVPRITTDELGNKQARALAMPRITTSGSPLNQVFLYQEGAAASASLSNPELRTLADDKEKIYVESGVARGHLRFAEPDIEAPAATRPVVQVPGQAMTEASLAQQSIETMKSPLKEVLLLQVQASMFSPASAPAITTQARVADRIVGYVSQSDLAGALAEPGMQPLRKLRCRPYSRLCPGLSRRSPWRRRI